MNRTRYSASVHAADRTDGPGRHGAHHRARRGSAFLCLLFLHALSRTGMGSMTEQREITLAWDPPLTNTDGTPVSDITGYRVHYGSASRVYDTIINVGLVITATCSNIPVGAMTFFAVTCYNSIGIESGLSGEAVFTPAPVMGCPQPSSVTGARGLVIPWSGIAGVRYSVERSTNLTAAPRFSTIATNVPGLWPVTMYADTTATGNGPYYYRVRQEP